jgi:hypothetical protein
MSHHDILQVAGVFRDYRAYSYLKRKPKTITQRSLPPLYYSE